MNVFALIAVTALTATAGLKVPLGLDPVPVPAENPMSEARVSLGKLLYFDTRLSADSTISCASCHDPARGWTDQAQFSTGIRGQKGGRNSPTVLNAAYLELQFWDGRAPSLEEQAKGPIANPVEMGFTHEGVVERLSGVKGYAPLFRKAFGDEKVTIDRVAQAIAAFERTALSGNAPYDRYQAGDKKALTEQQKAGMSLFFGKANCSSCHSGKSFTDGDFHNIGVGMDKKDPDLGRYAESKIDSDRGAFKTPMLRNLSDTFPYMHDGSQKTLEEVVDFYVKGGHPNESLSNLMKPLDMNADEKKALRAFMTALEGTKAVVKPPKSFPK